MEIKPILVAGVGSPGGDDQVGWAVIDLLQQRLQIVERPQKGVRLCSLRSPIDLLDYLDGVEQVHIVDACVSTSMPSHYPSGSVVRFCWPSDQMAAYEWTTTHDLQLPAVLELAQELKRLPARIVIWGIAVANVGFGTGPSRNLRHWANQAAVQIQQSIEDQG